MAGTQVRESGPGRLASGQRLQLPGENGVVVADAVVPRPGGVDLYVTDDAARCGNLALAVSQVVSGFSYPARTELWSLTRLCRDQVVWTCM